MANYTTLSMIVYLKPETESRIADLDKWIEETIFYNPDITPDRYKNEGSNTWTLDDGRVVEVPVYPNDPHEFFSNPDALKLVSLGLAGYTDERIWTYDPKTAVLEINAHFVNRQNALAQFFDWLSPMVFLMGESEFNTEDDLEGPRYVSLVGDRIEIAKWSFTR